MSKKMEVVYGKWVQESVIIIWKEGVKSYVSSIRKAVSRKMEVV